MRVDFFQIAANNNGNLIAEFDDAFRAAKARDLDFAVLSRRPFGATEKERIKAPLATEGVRSAAISVGVEHITGKGVAFSPKLPYVDENEIIVNVKRCKGLGIPERITQINVNSHFEDAGGIHATLLSFLEAVVPYGELHSYTYNKSDLEDVNPLWRRKVARGALQYIKGAFRNINYEIQKKYDNDKT